MACCPIAAVAVLGREAATSAAGRDDVRLWGGKGSSFNCQFHSSANQQLKPSKC